jgi:hypothetical protein
MQTDHEWITIGGTKNIHNGPDSCGTLALLYSPEIFEVITVTQAELTILVEKAKKIKMSPGDREQQRRSFAYGNANIENDAVTREVIDEVADGMEKTSES